MFSLSTVSFLVILSIGILYDFVWENCCWHYVYGFNSNFISNAPGRRQHTDRSRRNHKIHSHIRHWKDFETTVLYNTHGNRNAHMLIFGSEKISAPSLSLAGSILSTIKKFHVGPQKFGEIVHNVQLITEWEEIILLPIIAFGLRFAIFD
jgi:hypothetical protein